VNGVVTVKLPEYFEALTRKGQRTVQLTPSALGPLFLRTAWRAAVHGEDRERQRSQRFFWEVKACAPTSGSSRPKSTS